MLHEWLIPTSVAAFVELYSHKQPYARPDTARGAVSLFGSATLERILADDTPPDVLVITRVS